MGLIHEKTILIGETDLDTFGHVNNAAYLRLFEQARWDWITERGFGVEQIRASQTGPTVLEINIKFFKEVRLREQVVIRSEALDYRGKIGRVQQQMLRDGTDVVCEAVFVVGLFDLKQRKLILPSAEWRHAIGLELA